MDDHPTTRTDMNVTNEDDWPEEASIRATFSLPNSEKKNEEDEGEDERLYRLVYNERLDCILVVEANNTNTNNNNNNDENESNSNSESNNSSSSAGVVDVILPEDVIGCDLELRFLGGEELAEKISAMDLNSATGRGVGVQNTKSRDAADEIDRDYDKSVAVRSAEGAAEVLEDGGEAAMKMIIDPPVQNAAAAEEEAAEEEAGDCPASIVSELCENVIGTDADGDTAAAAAAAASKATTHATAFLNIYCYPHSPPNTFFSWCTSFLYSNNSSSPKSLPPPKSQRLQQQQQNQQTGSPLGKRQPCHRRLEVVPPCEDFADARSLVRAIRTIAKLGQFQQQTQTTTSSIIKDNSLSTNNNHTTDTPPLYLVLVNPRCGTGKAKSIYNQTVKPMLDQCGVDHRILYTTHSGHATQRMKYQQQQQPSSSTTNDHHTEDNDRYDDGRDILQYNAIICLGGDGTLHEIFQGIQTRPDASIIYQTIRFGIVGCGTGNGLSKSLTYASHENDGILESTFLICKGHSFFMDLSKYETSSNIYTSFLTMTYGLIADIDIDSEVLRCLGDIRLDLWAVYRILINKGYSAKFSYLPPTSTDTTDTTTTDTTEKVEEKDEKKDNWTIMPPLTEPVPNHWTVLEDDFVVFWASLVSHASSKTMHAPMCHLQDGLFHVIVVRKPVSRIQLANLSLKIETGEYIKDNEDNVEVYPCRAFRFEPICKGSYNDVDGEVVESGPIQAYVIPKQVCVFGKC